jgi:hypothetical protein
VLGGRRVQIGSLKGAFMVVGFSIIAQYGYYIYVFPILGA